MICIEAIHESDGGEKELNEGPSSGNESLTDGEGGRVRDADEGQPTSLLDGVAFDFKWALAHIW
jgi:hypothetical protein